MGNEIRSKVPVDSKMPARVSFNERPPYVGPLANDGKPFDYIDPDGSYHLMAACGHRVEGMEPGEKLIACPNCRYRAIAGEEIELVYPGRISDERKVDDADNSGHSWEA